MSEYSDIVEIIEDIFGNIRKHNEHNHQLSVDCPVCSYDIKNLSESDGKGNLEINYGTGVYKCWSCYETHNTYGKLRWLVKKYGKSTHLKRFDIFYPDNESIFKKDYDKVILPKEYIPFDEISSGFKLTPVFKQSFNYLKNRGVTEEIISKFKIGACYDGFYSGRIIFPSYDSDDELNYFVGRSFLSKPKLKYRNPEAEKEKIIWNENLIDWEKPITLVEGPFDSIFVDNSIPLLGKVLSPKLHQSLYNNAKEITIILDGDAYDNAVKLYHKLNCGKLMGRIYIIRLPVDKDIADLRGQYQDYERKQIN